MTNHLCSLPFRSLTFALALAAILIPGLAQADVTLPNVFSDHMVLQRDFATPVFGWADPGERVTVSFAGQEQVTTADSQGRWQVELEPMPASNTGQTMTVAAANQIDFEDVLVGDVWICSGQSNMEWSVAQSLNPEQEIAAGDHPTIRLFNVPGHPTATSPQQQGGGDWVVCSPESLPRFSAVGYYFGRQLATQTDVPVGLIGTNWGGTRIEPWTPPVGFRQIPELSEISQQVDAYDPSTEQGRANWDRYHAELETYLNDARHALATGGSLPNPIATPGFRASNQPTTIYNAMVHPLIPYGIRGAIWYQGESNGNEGVEYFHKMQALIQGWRSAWGQEEFPIYFYWVHLANFRQPNESPEGGDGWARVREAQRQALTIPNTGMAVTLDIGQANDIHPRNKQDVGRRLARWALRDVHQMEIVPSGPLYREMTIEENQIRLHFDHAENGLMVGIKDGLTPTVEDQNGSLTCFAIAGADKQWVWADAVIEGSTVVVSTSEVENPVAVRFGYSTNPEGINLYNKEGLPASSFRTDEW